MCFLLKKIVQYHPVLITRHGIREQNYIEHSLYEFIPCLQETRNKIGRNVVVSRIREDLNVFLQKYVKYFIYEIVFSYPKKWLQHEHKYVNSDSFVPLLFNSDNEVIGFVNFSLNSSAIFVFPQLIDEKKDFLIELIEEILPGLFPRIFPYSEQFSWLESEKYFLPNQATLLENKQKIEDEYKRALVEVEEEIQQNHIAHQFLHDLITETGDLLVRSVEIFLKWLGFADIINMDETNPEIKEEDLYIPLDNGLLVVEIKGIGGTSKDSECSQISKIKYRRVRERESFDVFALYLVNHQRYLPANERKNPPFSEHQIADAQSDERGLLTTYEIFKLYFNIEEGFITKEDAKSTLLEYGLVQFKPSNASSVGCPLEVHYEGKVVILNVDNFFLHKGTTIIVCNDGDWFKAEVLEIQLDGEAVESASEGEIGVQLSRSVLKTPELWLQDINHKQ